MNMLYNFLYCLPGAIIIYCVLNLKKKNYLWNLLITIGTLPFIELIMLFFVATFHGSGLVGDQGGITSGIFVCIMLLFGLWYIYAGAIFLLIFSINKMKKNTNEEKNLTILEKAIMMALIVTNSVFLLNFYFVLIDEKPLILYGLYNKSNTIYYGIGITVEKIAEGGMTSHVEFISLIILLCISFAVSYIFLKQRDKTKQMQK